MSADTKFNKLLDNLDKIVKDKPDNSGVYRGTPAQEQEIKEFEIKECNEMLRRGELAYKDNQLEFTREKQC